MKISRRHLSFLLPALTAASAKAQRSRMPSKVFQYSELNVRTRENNPNTSRSYFDGPTHTGFNIELHETTLMPGLRPHAPHHHVREELFILREGTVEMMIEGNTAVVSEPGSVAFIASNEEHGVMNVGKTPAKYFVMAIG